MIFKEVHARFKTTPFEPLINNVGNIKFIIDKTKLVWVPLWINK